MRLITRFYGIAVLAGNYSFLKERPCKNKIFSTSAGTNAKDTNICSLSIFSTNVFFYQTFVTVVIIVQM